MNDIGVLLMVMSSLDLAADPDQASAAASADPLCQPWLAPSSRRSSRRQFGQFGQFTLALEA